MEGSYQSGDVAGTPVKAWSVMLEGGYTFPDKPLEPRFGLQANVFSEDSDPSDDTVGTFVGPDPRLLMLSSGVFFNFSNMVNIEPSVTFKPASSLTIKALFDFYARQNRQDLVYIGATGAGFPAYEPDRHIGNAPGLEANWQVTDRLQVFLFETYFSASDAFKANGGESGNYLGLFSTYRF